MTRQNAAMLRWWLEHAAAERARPFVADKRRWEKPGDLRETSHMQSMAALLAAEFEALSRGAGECPKHEGQVAGACPICRGLWSELGGLELGQPEPAGSRKRPRKPK